MKTNKCIFVDIEECLISTISGKKYPLTVFDWRFNDEVIEFINNNPINQVCIIGNRNPNNLNNYKRYDNLIKAVQDKLGKIIKNPLYSIFYNTADKFFQYPYPGGILTISIDNDILLRESIYITNNEAAFSHSSIGRRITMTELILNG